MPLGAARITLLAFQPRNVPLISSWEDWTTTNVGTTKLESPTDILYRELDVAGGFSDDEFFTIGGSSANFTDWRINKYNVSGSTLTYSSQSSFTGPSAAFTNNNIVSLPGLNKAICINATSYVVFTYSSGNLSYTSQGTGITNIGNSLFVSHPTDETKFYRTGNTGISEYLTFNSGTNTLTSVRSTSAITNCKTDSTTAFFTESNGIYGYAIVWFDTSINYWKVRHYNIDLTSYTDYTLNSGTNYAAGAVRYANHKQKLNKAVVAYDNNSTMPCFSFSYNGSNFAQSSEVNLTIPSATYTNVRFMPGLSWIDNDAWAITSHMDDGSTTIRENFVGIIDASGVAPVLKGWVATTNANQNSGNVRTGLITNSSKTLLLVVADNNTSGEGQPSLNLLLKP